MLTGDYHNILGLSQSCSIHELKKAYRMKARQYHPDLNDGPDAAELFIKATEAYEYLLRKLTRSNEGTITRDDFQEQWDTHYRQQVRERARHYSESRFDDFVRSRTYRTARVYNLATIILGMAFSILIIAIDIYSYSWLKINAELPEDEPSVSFMILILLLGISFLTFSSLNMLSFMKSKKKIKNETENQ